MVDIDKTVFYLNREQEERHTQEAAKKFNLAYINLSNYPITQEILDIVPKEKALQYQIVPYLKVGETLKIGIVNPNDENTKKYIESIALKLKIKTALSLISRSSLFYGILAYENLEKEAKEKLDVEAEEKKSTFEEDISDLKSAALAAKKVTTTKLLDVIMTGAVKTKASDVHIEPEEEGFLVRYRIDGVLQDVVRLPKGHYKTLLSRIKFLAKLKMDNSTRPQDGRFSIKVGEGQIDLRISTLPSASGEAVVIRLLGQEVELFRLDKLGFRPDAKVAIRNAISKPHGMILTSGPTGSGKSSTLYALLMELNKSDVKIITLEDPVEYRIEGVEQSQIKKDEDYTFANGLRAALRQDPDIIMVGEVRDPETAEIAVQAALTGHLMLSTIHANSAPGVFIRLLDIGVKPFLLSGSINLVMAQRLVRKICPNCVEEFVPRKEIWQEVQKTLDPIKNMLESKYQAYLSSKSIKLKRGKGCEKCHHAGFLGRQVIVEVMIPDENIEQLISKEASIAEFTREAQRSGMISMEQDGLVKVLQGVTTIEEVWRVTKE